MSGKEIKLFSVVCVRPGLRGKPVTINFWATWCPPCRDEIPVITGMYNETHSSDNYKILAVVPSLMS